jgi:hypothetical protein
MGDYPFVSFKDNKYVTVDPNLIDESVWDTIVELKVYVVNLRGYFATYVLPIEIMHVEVPKMVNAAPEFTE